MPVAAAVGVPPSLAGGYGFIKPKHHYVAHAPLDILKLGPIKGFWCWSFEGFHQVMKQIAATSNFKGNVCKHLVEVWRFQFGLRYFKRKMW